MEIPLAKENQISHSTRPGIRRGPSTYYNSLAIKPFSWKLAWLVAEEFYFSHCLAFNRRDNHVSDFKPVIMFSVGLYHYLGWMYWLYVITGKHQPTEMHLIGSSLLALIGAPEKLT
jgi:hypothetical protein